MNTYVPIPSVIEMDNNIIIWKISFGCTMSEGYNCIDVDDYVVEYKDDYAKSIDIFREPRICENKRKKNMKKYNYPNRLCFRFILPLDKIY